MDFKKRTIWNVVVAYLEFRLGDLFTVVADVATAVGWIHLPCGIVTKQIYLNFQIHSNLFCRDGVNRTWENAAVVLCPAHVESTAVALVSALHRVLGDVILYTGDVNVLIT